MKASSAASNQVVIRGGFMAASLKKSIPHEANRGLRARSAVSYLGSVNVERKSRLEEAVWVNPRRVSGVPCFRGTRVPIQSLIDLLEGGETIDDFLKLYPQVARQQVLAVLDFANSQLLECASSLMSA
jgi:uncharacterized protein (DUF433 family)